MFKFRSLLALVLLLVVLSTGGCGGGGGGGSSKSHNYETPTPFSDDVPAPNPEPDPEPELVSNDFDIFDPEFWISQLENPNQPIYSLQEIKLINEKLSKDIGRMDLSSIISSDDIAKAQFIDYWWYDDSDKFVVGGAEFSISELFNMFEEGTEALDKLTFAIVTKPGEVLDWPIFSQERENLILLLGDDILRNIANIGEPIIVSEVCHFNGQNFYYGQSEFYRGWLPEECLAFCASRDEWNTIWNISEDELVVVTNPISLDNVILGIGTKFKKDMDNTNSIFVPTRGIDGQCEMVSTTVDAENISYGYVPFTQANFIRELFCAAENNLVDFNWYNPIATNEQFNRVLKTFGFNLSNKFDKVPYVPNPDSFSRYEEFMKDLPVGSIIDVEGVIGVYIGTEKYEFLGDIYTRYYVLSALSSIDTLSISGVDGYYKFD